MELHSEGMVGLYRSTRPPLTTHQLFYIFSSFYIIFLMTSAYARTREREKGWKLGLYCLLGSMVMTPIWYTLFNKWIGSRSTIVEVYMGYLRKLGCEG